LHKENTKLIGGTVYANMLYLGWVYDKPVLAWHTPAESHHVTYSKNLNIPNGKIAAPPMLWLWNDYHRNLAVWALPDDQRPTEKTDLYHAPFHNVYPDGRICLGSGSKHITPCKTFISLMAACERVFWNTTFSESHNDRAVSGNLNSLHHELITTGCPFPMDRLNKTRATFKSITS